MSREAGALRAIIPILPARDLSATRAFYWRVRDVEALHARCRAIVSSGDGIPRVGALEEQPWGMREFALVDPDGNLVRVGEELG